MVDIPRLTAEIAMSPPQNRTERKYRSSRSQSPALSADYSEPECHPGMPPGRSVAQSVVDYSASSTELNCIRAFASAMPTLTDSLQTQTAA